MSYQVQYLHRAIKNLQEIYDYISEDSITLADKVIDEIDDRVAELEQMPAKYSIYPDKPTYRRMVVGSYLVFYKIFEEKKIVKIYLIVHSKRRFDSLLR